MIIKINEDWAITTDADNWRVSKWGKPSEKNPKGKWMTKSYHRNIESAFQEIFQSRIRLIPNECPIHEIKEEIGKIGAELREAWGRFNEIELG